MQDAAWFYENELQIRWGKSVVLARATNLNNVGFCGTYSGANLVNAPAGLGTTNIKLEVICTGAAGYVTQIAYQMEFPESLTQALPLRAYSSGCSMAASGLHGG